MPFLRAAVISRGTIALSPSPWTVGGIRTIDTRTPCEASASAATSQPIRAAPGEAGSGASRSLTRRPDASVIVGNATTRGTPVAASTDPKTPIAF